EDQTSDPGLARENGDGERAAYRAHAPVEREFADRERVGQVFRFAEVAVRAEYAERDGEVEARALFANVCGREVDGRLVEREEEGAVVDGGAYALARLAHGEVWQADDCDGRGRVGLAARGRQVNFGVNEVCVNAVNGCGLCEEKHGREVS